MRQKTVRLSDDYEIRNGQVGVWQINCGWEPGDDGEPSTWTPCTAISVGNLAMLYSTEDVSPDALRDGTEEHYHLSFDPRQIEEGMAGNSDRNIRRFHGWRGTTNDCAVTAYGVRHVIAIRTLNSGQIAITVGDDVSPDTA
ncbi:MAG: hypothetical protein GY700_10040 [Propionibacteriaceae bacterium]|nr:hypothetical protein [Propionibacteriaceae bacterium]